MNNEFEFQVYEDSKADCLKVFKTKLMDLVDTNGLKLIGKYMTEENGTSIRSGMAAAVKRSNRKRTVILVFFIIENNELIDAFPYPVGVADNTTYKESVFVRFKYFLKYREIQRDFWFNMLERTTLHHFFLGVFYSSKYLEKHSTLTRELMDETLAAAQTYVYELKYKFLALLSWYAMYAAVVYGVYQHFFNR